MAHVHEWLNLIFRWVHIIAGIMWIGDSFLFMWLDKSLTPPTKQRDGDVQGELWMTHSGGFYEVIKRKSLRKEEMPATLHWFKWESYTTWITGFLLLHVTYHMNKAALLVDPSVSSITSAQAVLLSVALLPAAYGLYELLWLTPLKQNQKVFAAVGVVIIGAVAYGLLQIFSARGAYLQLGAMIGTVMSANVFFRIIPAQKHMLTMTRAGTAVDTTYGARAKGRSIQNHYLTLPVIFTMISNHFPSTYGAPHPWLVLTLLVVFGMGLKYFMNFRRQTSSIVLIGTALALAGAVVLTRPISIAEAAASSYKDAPTVSFATVTTIMDARCTTCHAVKPASNLFPMPPQGVTLDTPEAIKRHAERVFMRSVATKTMPLANMTGMTDEERSLLGAWFAQGADIDAAGPSQISIGQVVQVPIAPATDGGAATAATSDNPKANELFTVTCAGCHGPGGKGDGIAAAAMDPKPRDFTSAEWQASITDEQLKKIILEGGPAVGKSILMPPNPTLADDPETTDAIIKMIRGLKK